MINPNFQYYQYYKINPVTDEMKNNYVSNGVKPNLQIPKSFGFGILNLFWIW